MTSSNGNIFALLVLCAGNSPVTGEFPAQRPVTRSFDVFFNWRLNKRLSKQSWGWWFETPSCPLWHHCKGCHVKLLLGESECHGIYPQTTSDFLKHMLMKISYAQWLATICQATHLSWHLRRHPLELLMSRSPLSNCSGYHGISVHGPYGWLHSINR